MSFKVVMTARVLSQRDLEPYQKLGIEVATTPCQTEAEIIAAAKDADAVITLMQPYSRRVIESLKNLKLIYNAGTGFDTIDVAAATERGICVAYPGDYCYQEVAEHTMALLLACARKITRLDRAVREGKWSTFEKREIRGKILPPIFQLQGQTLGLIGMGRIGQAVVPKSKGFGMKVIAHDPYLAPEVFGRLGVESVSFEHLLKNSDFVSIHSNLTPRSVHVLGLEQFKQMKPTAYLVNVSRGAFIDEAALHTALGTGLIAGAGIDVVEAEPEAMPPDHPLLKLDNTIVTAHSAYYSENSSAKYKERVFEAISAVARGKWPEWIVNPEVKKAR